MNYKPIIVVAGEPYSVFLEIFFKTIAKNKFKKPIILISSKKLLINQMKKLNFDFKINLINKDDVNFSKINNKKINLIDVKFKFSKTFDKISDKSNLYIAECFDVALKLLKKKNFCWFNKWSYF